MVRYWVVGARRTGSNWLVHLLNRNFEDAVFGYDKEYAYKHGLNLQAADEAWNVLLTVKTPPCWIPSVWDYDSDPEGVQALGRQWAFQYAWYDRILEPCTRLVVPYLSLIEDVETWMERIRDQFGFTPTEAYPEDVTRRVHAGGRLGEELDRERYFNREFLDRFTEKQFSRLRTQYRNHFGPVLEWYDLEDRMTELLREGPA